MRLSSFLLGVGEHYRTAIQGHVAPGHDGSEIKVVRIEQQLAGDRDRRLDALSRDGRLPVAVTIPAIALLSLLLWGGIFWVVRALF